MGWSLLRRDQQFFSQALCLYITKFSDLVCGVAISEGDQSALSHAACACPLLVPALLTCLAPRSRGALIDQILDECAKMESPSNAQIDDHPLQKTTHPSLVWYSRSGGKSWSCVLAREKERARRVGRWRVVSHRYWGLLLLAHGVGRDLFLEGGGQRLYLYDRVCEWCELLRTCTRRIASVGVGAGDLWDEGSPTELVAMASRACEVLVSMLDGRTKVYLQAAAERYAEETSLAQKIVPEGCEGAKPAERRFSAEMSLAHQDAHCGRKPVGLGTGKRVRDEMDQDEDTGRVHKDAKLSASMSRSSALIGGMPRALVRAMSSRPCSLANLMKDDVLGQCGSKTQVLVEHLSGDDPGALWCYVTERADHSTGVEALAKIFKNNFDAGKAFKGRRELVACRSGLDVSCLRLIAALELYRQGNDRAKVADAFRMWGWEDAAGLCSAALEQFALQGVGAGDLRGLAESLREFVDSAGVLEQVWLQCRGKCRLLLSCISPPPSPSAPSLFAPFPFSHPSCP